MAWVFQGISRGRSPREIPRKTHAIPSSDEKSSILFNVSFSGGGLKKMPFMGEKGTNLSRSEEIRFSQGKVKMSRVQS